MSAKQSLNITNWVRLGNANPAKSHHRKTLNLCSENPGNNWTLRLPMRLGKLAKGRNAKDRVLTRMNTSVAS